LETDGSHPTHADDPDPRAELTEISRMVRAHLERYAASGAWGLQGAWPKARGTRAAGSGEAAARDLAPRAARPLPAVSVAPEAPVAPRVASLESAARADPAGPMASPVALPIQQTTPEAAARLTVLADEVRACTRCALHAARSQTVFSRGSGTSGLVFVGEGPGEEEDRLGEPFVGPAGQLLDRMIAAMRLERDAVYVCNIVKCRPPRNRKPEPSEMAECTPYLIEQLDLIKPRVIVALGATAVQGLLGTTEGITRLRGQWKLYRGKVPVMPTFHPAYLLRTPQAKREVWKDLQEVLKHLTTTSPPA
jgi:uracil-DNA glycosylase family 4